MNAAAKIDFPGVNAGMICDCQNQEFRVGVQVLPNGSNHIPCLECTACGKKFAVPYFHDATGDGEALRKEGADV